jgi:hypothetical protein
MYMRNENMKKNMKTTAKYVHAEKN